MFPCRPHTVQFRQQAIQSCSQGLFRIFMQKLRLPLGRDIFRLPLLAQNICHAFEGLGSFGKTSLAAEGHQSFQAFATVLYLSRTRTQRGIHQQGVLPLTHEIVAQPCAKEFHKFIESFCRRQFPLPVPVKLLRPGKNLTHVEPQAKIKHNTNDAQSATAKTVGVRSAGGYHPQAETARERVGLVGQ